MSKLVELPINDIILDRDNPRIKHFLDIYGGNNVPAEAIALALSNSSNSGDTTSSFAALRDSIKVSKGIIHPIIVSKEEDGTYIVIEGNTRLQIYKEYDKNEPNGPWATIPALVYDNLSPIDKHKIRLQSHLVGPRQWDAYSKAKYLWQLSEVEHLPIAQIIALCGGGKAEIQRNIDAYLYMETKYRPMIQSRGLDFNVRDFSKFAEYQNSNIKKNIQQAGFDENAFAEWVADDLIDNAQKVRLLPGILKDPDAKNKFLHSNISEAEKIIHAKEIENADLSKYPYYVLAQGLYKKMALDDPSVTEMKEIAEGATDEALRKKYYLESLRDKINLVLDTISAIQMHG